MKCLKTYGKYKIANEEYKKRRRDLFKEPEEKMREVGEDLNVYELRKQVERDVKKLTDKSWRLYRKIWDKSSSQSDIDKFLKLMDVIAQYQDFIPEENMKVIMVTKDLVWAFSQSYQQKSVFDEPTS